MTGKLPAKVESAFPEYPFRLLTTFAATFPKGTANPLSHGLRRASSPEGGALFVLTGSCKKAPPSGELAATIGSSLRGLASPWGSWRAAPEGVGLAAYNTKKRPALPVEMRGALVIQAYASG